MSRPRPPTGRGGRRIGRRRLAAAGLLGSLLVAGTGWLLLGSSLLALRSLEVSGGVPAVAASVRAAADVPYGRPLARVDLDAIERRVEAVPAVADAVVTRRWPRTVAIRVVERRAVLAAADGGGWQLLDGTGTVFSRTTARPPALPLLALDPGTTNPQQRRAAAAVVAALPGDLAAKVAQVSARSPDDVQLRLTDGALVRWGSAQDGGLKAQVLRALLPRQARGYDVRAPDAPTTSAT